MRKLAVLSALLLWPVLAANQQPPLLLGTAWYPEQWPESRWDEDLRLMQAAGIHMVRVGEFAWSRMQPAEDRYDLDWLDHAVTAAAKRGMVVVLGTPTAAPPAWMTQKYPDTLRVDRDGRSAVHGQRAHFSFTSPRYREFCRKIAEQMALRFGHNPAVVGWQIDNEYGNVSYDDVTLKQFQQWLRAKYKTLDALNDHWTTTYWSQTYFDWSQVPFGTTGHNPGLMLEFKRFVTETYKDYQHVQVAALRAHCDRRQFITSNFMGWYDAFDHYVLNEELDLASWDDYVGRGHLDPMRNGIIHDLTRGLKRRNFWVMETQPGSVNWSDVNNALDRGEVRAMAWHAIGHGADTVAYWQWRSALNGQEQIHGNLVAPDGKPVPLYEEVAQIGREFALAGDALAGTSIETPVALLHSYDSRWAIDGQRHHKDFDPVALLSSYYRALRAAGQQVDVINAAAPLTQYKLVIAPALNVLPDETARMLADYVRQGGHLVLGPRSGMKDEYNALHTVRQPGPVLAPLLGSSVEQFYALNETVPVSGAWGQGTATIWGERLEASGTETLLTYGASNGWLDGRPAAVTRVVGKGRITYIGAWLDDALMAKAEHWMLTASNVSGPYALPPDGVEVCRRTAPGKEALVVVNHTVAPKTVKLAHPMRSVLQPGAAVSEVQLPPRGVDVLVAK